MKDTIAAIATPAGKGGVAIIRMSGLASLSIAQAITKRSLEPRVAIFCSFKSTAGEVLDEGLVLFFKAPYSFTGEDVVELQGHGGPVVMDRLLQETLRHGARLAKPGEFCQRAFLNNKMDLAQAEAVADLINASSQQAAQSAARSLQGEFSQHIKKLSEQLIQLRMMVEAAIDFPEEEIDFIADSTMITDLEALLSQLRNIKNSAKQGVLLQEGLSVVIVGKPNAGKSSLLNALSGRDSAIVTEMPGTTRDILREYIQIDGLPLHIIDTAGIRTSDNVIEQEGMRRAQQAMDQADLILLLQDITEQTNDNIVLPNKPVMIIKNKVDLQSKTASVHESKEGVSIHLSVKTGEGLNLLCDYLKRFAGFEQGESNFIARRRHLDALQRCCEFIQKGLDEIQDNGAAELLAEELRAAQKSLGEITGEFTSDDLLGRIFSSFCIGK